MNRVSRHKTYDTTTDGSLKRFRRMLVSWLGLFLLAANVIGGGALPAHSASAPFAQDISGDRFVVCTASGMVVMDRNGHIVDSKGEGGGHATLCVFCLPLMHGGAQTPAAVAVTILPDERPTGAAITPTEPTRPTPLRLAGAASPRAPPLT